MTNPKVSRFLWLDLEMTGLNPATERIIEVAAIVTSIQHEELECYHKVIKQDSVFLDRMDKWNMKQHKKSGLYDQVPKGSPQKEVEQELISLVTKHFKGDKAILAGNSIYQDRLFIKGHFKNLESKLHYRMLDVSSWKIIFESKRIFYKKQNKHRALDDVRESIEELKYYLLYLNHLKLESDKASGNN